MPSGHAFDVDLPPVTLEAGARLATHRLHGWTDGPSGELRFDDAPVVVVAHALTGDAIAADWWGPIVRPGGALDPRRWRVVCFNNLGGCYGSSGPLDPSFPTWLEDRAHAAPDPPKGALPALPPAAPATVTTWDQARSLIAALDALNVDRVHLATGGSLGGMIVLAAAALDTRRFERIAPIAACAAASPWIIAWNHVGRQVIIADPLFPNPHRGLALARQLAHVTYRAEPGLFARHGRDQATETWSPGAPYRVQTYLEHQGNKLCDRFDARAYLCQIGAMDHHDLRRAPPDGFSTGNPADPAEAATPWGPERIRASALVVAIDSDQLYLPGHSGELVASIRSGGAQVEAATIHSQHGHDAFLIEWDQVTEILQRALTLSKPRELE